MNDVSNKNLNEVISDSYNISDRSLIKKINDQLNEISQKIKEFDKFIEEYRKSKIEEEKFYRYWTEEFKKLDIQIQNK